MKTSTAVTLIGLALLGIGCESHQLRQSGDMNSESLSASDVVKINAELALKQCGKNNVKKVTTTGYSCKNGKP